MSSYEEGELLGHQRPRISHLPAWGPNLVPDSKVDVLPPELGNLGREIVELSEMAGLILDPWQAWTMAHAHAVRPDKRYWNPYTSRYENLWAAKEVGVMVSRQNGKGSILEARELAGLFLFGERLIIHSAHQFDTSKEAFERILMLIEQTPDLDREVGRVSRSHGEEGVELKNGQRLRFRTRTKGGGRGFTGDCLILDEAMYLGQAMVNALMPTLSARPNPQIWYTGSAGDRESEQFGRVRERAIDGEDEDLLFWAEWSIDGHNEFCHELCEEHDSPKSVESFAKANPGLGIRISVEHVQMEQRSMSKAGFAQERLGVGDWPVQGAGWKIISKDAWMSRTDETSDITGNVVIAIDSSLDGAMSCVTVAGRTKNGDLQVEITTEDGEYHHRPGTGWVEDVVKRLWKAHRPYAVVIDKAGQAGQFFTGFDNDKTIKVISPNTREYAQTCAEFKESIVPKPQEKAYLVHIDQAPMAAAISGADRRVLAGLWAWDRTSSSVDISPLVSATLAMWGLKQSEAAKSSVPMIAFM